MNYKVFRGVSFCEDGFSLRCPACGSEWLHQRTVDVGFRGKEDEPESNIISVSVNTTTVARGSIAGRRDAIHISFECETCPARPMLTIMQHKGMTEVLWEPLSAPVERKAVRK